MKKLTTFLMLSCLLVSCKPKKNPDQKPIAEKEITIPEEIPFTSIDFASVSPETLIVYDKLNFGNGYNSVTGREYFGVISYDGASTSTEVIADALGNTGKITMDILESKESLKKSLNITAKVDLDVKVFGVSSDNSLKADLYTETTFDDFTQNAILKAEYVNEPKVLINPKVKDEWISLARRKPDEFMRTCGDMFVSRIYTGGSMYALFSLSSKDSEQKEKNEVFFKSVNKYAGNKLGVEASSTEINNTMNSVTNINTQVFTEGGGDTPTEKTLDAFISYANKFKTQVGADSRPIILYVELSPYESIAGFPKINFDKIRVHQKKFLTTCIDYYNEVEASIENAKFVINNSEYFDEDEARAKIKITELEAYLVQLKSAIAICESDFNDCQSERLKFLETFESYEPEIDFPEFEGDAKILPVRTEDAYVTVFENTKEGKILDIQGELESRFRKNDAEVTCKDVIKNEQRISFIVNKNIPIPYLYEFYAAPYYRIRYVSLGENPEVLRELDWGGTPIVTERNVRVDVKLVNPKAKLQMIYGAKGYFDLPAEYEKILGFESAPHYRKVRACDTKAPMMIISALDAKEKETKPLMKASNAPSKLKTKKNRPNVIRKGDYMVYEY